MTSHPLLKQYQYTIEAAILRSIRYRGEDSRVRLEAGAKLLGIKVPLDKMGEAIAQIADPTQRAIMQQWLDTWQSAIEEQKSVVNTLEELCGG